MHPVRGQLLRDGKDLLDDFLAADAVDVLKVQQNLLGQPFQLLLQRVKGIRKAAFPCDAPQLFQRAVLAQLCLEVVGVFRVDLAALQHLFQLPDEEGFDLVQITGQQVDLNDLELRLKVGPEIFPQKAFSVAPFCVDAYDRQILYVLDEPRFIRHLFFEQRRLLPFRGCIRSAAPQQQTRPEQKVQKEQGVFRRGDHPQRPILQHSPRQHKAAKAADAARHHPAKEPGRGVPVQQPQRTEPCRQQPQQVHQPEAGHRRENDQKGQHRQHKPFSLRQKIAFHPAFLPLR